MSTDRDPTRRQRFLVDRMRSIEGVVTEWVHAQVTNAGAEGLSVAHARLMAELGPGSRPSELARRLGVTRGAVGQLVDRLEAGGFVTREPDPLDRRAHIVRPTARAASAYVVGRQSLLGIEDEWRRILGPRLMADLARALEVLDNWHPPEPDDS
jgi:DNA-binding MarR family transcriptional regulator